MSQTAFGRNSVTIYFGAAQVLPASGDHRAAALVQLRQLLRRTSIEAPCRLWLLDVH